MGADRCGRSRRAAAVRRAAACADGALWQTEQRPPRRSLLRPVRIRPPVRAAAAAAATPPNIISPSFVGVIIFLRTVGSACGHITVGYRFPSEQRSQARSSSGSTSIREGEGRLSAACFFAASWTFSAPFSISFPNYLFSKSHPELSKNNPRLCALTLP